MTRSTLRSSRAVVGRGAGRLALRARAWPAEAAPLDADEVPPAVSLLGLRTLMEEMCAEELAAMRLRARGAASRSPEAPARVAGVTTRGELA